VKESDHVEDLRIHGKIILELILGSRVGSSRTACTWFRI